MSRIFENEYEAQNEHFYNYGILKKGEYDFLDNLYTNKKVAIVGPAATIVGSGLGEYIDSFDTIVRLNKSVPLNKSLSGDIGSSTDVLYHSLDKLAKTVSHNYLNIDEYVKAGLKGFVASCRVNWITRDNLKVFYDLNTSQSDKGIYEDRIPTRTISPLIRKLEESGTIPNTGMVAIKHLLTYKTKKLFVCGFDFYDTYYYEGYATGRYRRKNSINMYHDIEQHRNIIANWYQNNDHFEIDEVMENTFKQNKSSTV